MPDFICELRNLQVLEAEFSALSALPQSIGELAQLEELNVSANALTALPKSLGKLTQLKRLRAYSNVLTGLPESLGSLARLIVLDVSHNELATLPEFVNRLMRLQQLSISSNQLTALPEFLGQLALLVRLDVSENKLTELPQSLGRLARLLVLDVSHNQLSGLPDSLSRLRSLQQLSLHGNEALGIPAEILGPTVEEMMRGPDIRAAAPASILEYYFRTRGGRRALNEAKLILVGRGGVGKTCLIKRLLYNTFDEQEHETPGIDIQPWEIEVADGDHVRLHVWDFGGQRILHGTHQFFLTERTLYLLVLSGREDSATQDAEYWLQLIRSFGGNSKVIIALNKSRQHPFDVNRGLLLEKYPFIADFVKTDCKDPALGLEELRDLIFTQTDALEHRKTAFPAEWFSIKERLAGMNENFVTWEQYQEICRRLGETSVNAQRELAKFLHILGIALHYADDPRLQDTRVLKPTWVTDGIYTLLRAVQREKSGGILYPADIGRALDSTNYPGEKHDFLLRLLERFQLCFRLPGNPERYLVAELLGENQPDIKNDAGRSGIGVPLPIRSLAGRIAAALHRANACAQRGESRFAVAYRCRLGTRWLSCSRARRCAGAPGGYSHHWRGADEARPTRDHPRKVRRAASRFEGPCRG